jgi:hypothetical protein
LCVSIQVPSTPGPNLPHVCLLLFVLSASPVAPSQVRKNRSKRKLATTLKLLDLKMYESKVIQNVLEIFKNLDQSSVAATHIRMFSPVM